MSTVIVATKDYQTTVTLDGALMRGIDRVRFDHSCRDVPRVELHLVLVDARLEAEPHWIIVDPVTGNPVEISGVVRLDGSVMSLPSVAK